MKLLLLAVAAAAGFTFSPAGAQVIIGPPAGGGGGSTSSLPGTVSLFALPPFDGETVIPPESDFSEVDARAYTTPGGPVFGEARQELETVQEEVVHALAFDRRNARRKRAEAWAARIVAQIAARIASLEMLEEDLEGQLARMRPGAALAAEVRQRLSDNRTLQAQLRQDHLNAERHFLEIRKDLQRAN